jgi:hypothetical protein
MFLAAEAKVRDEFEGNDVDLGVFRLILFTSSNENNLNQDPCSILSAVVQPATTFKFPDERKLWIEGCATKEDLAHPAEFDSEGQHCLMVGKDGNATDLTVGRYTSLILFTRNKVGIKSVEHGIYNSGDKTAEV